MANLRIDWATHSAAKYACQTWHYSRTIPVPPLVKIGVWEESEFIGVVIFSRGASSNLLKPYHLSQDQGCELTRVALNSHLSEVTRIISLSIKYLKKNSPKLRLIVSFADPNQGHHGGIYQAGNWVYTGVTAKSKKYEHNGKMLHTRQVTEKGFNVQHGNIRKTPKPSECTVTTLLGKHRYLMPLDSEMREKIQPLAQPYPKRDKQAMAGTTGTAAVQR